MKGLLLTGLVIGLFAGLLGADVARPSSADAAEPTGPGFQAARLRYGGGGDWYSAPSALPNLARALRERTTVSVERLEEAQIAISDPEFFSYPYLFINGHGNIRFTDSEVERLRRYLLAGGFLFADDNYGMDESFRREMARVFPDRKLTPVPFAHPIYHCFYDLPSGPPKVHEHDGKPSQGFGYFDGDRLMVLYTVESDIGNGLEDLGTHDDSPEVREQAMRMAINTVVYSLTH